MLSDDTDTLEQWTCPRCGEEEHDEMLVMDEEIEVDVTCQSVYFTFNDDSGNPGMAFHHEVFEDIIEHYQSSRPDDEDLRYCTTCDNTTTEWDTDYYDGVEVCDHCRGTLYESEDEYVSEMVQWLGGKFDWSQNDVLSFLDDKNNPGKGKALACVSTKERRDGEYLYSDANREDRNE